MNRSMSRTTRLLRSSGATLTCIGRHLFVVGAALAVATVVGSATASAQTATPTATPVVTADPASGEKPNILVIFGDDIGQTNISAYSNGLMGYRTPNIDSIAERGMLFTDYYAENSCTAGRSSFITGQTPLRTGLSKVGAPGAPVGIQSRDITIAEALKPLGYATGQFGKNHLGDKDEYLPTNHGFDEFFGNLYHLNAEEEPTGRPTRTIPSSRISRPAVSSTPSRTARSTTRAR
jgi:arylsulfatase A-like enzyme